MSVFMQFRSVFGACNATENIELCYQPMKTPDLISACNKMVYLLCHLVFCFFFVCLFFIYIHIFQVPIHVKK